jgi:hypothetical protein
MATLNDWDKIHPDTYFSHLLARNIDAFRLRPVVQPVAPDPLAFHPEIGTTTSHDHGVW